MPVYEARRTIVVDRIETVETVLVEVPNVTASNLRAAPAEIVGANGIPVSGAQQEFLFVKGAGGPVVVTASPRIAAGTTVGQELILKGTSDTDTVTIANGQGVEINGTCVLKSGSLLRLLWDGTIWGEVSRNDF